jgi:hypothetical protein
VFLLGVDGNNCIQRLLEAARSDAGAFERAWRFLSQTAEAELFEDNFARAVLSLDFRHHCEAISQYLADLFARKGTDAEALLRPLMDSIRLRAEFLAGIVDDGEPVRTADVGPMVAALTVAGALREGRERAAAAVQRLVGRTGEIQAADEGDAAEVSKFTSLLQEIVG